MVASKLPYKKVQKLLNNNAHINKCNKLVVSCYDNLLENYFGYERHNCNYNYTVQEISDMYYNNTVLMRTKGHLTIAVKGQVIDIFDCTQSFVDIYWIVK